MPYKVLDEYFSLQTLVENKKTFVWKAAPFAISGRFREK
jgi:hypothetical protein